MKRRFPKLLLGAVVLVAAGLILHERAARRAAARDRDRELSQRLAGPLLPGAPDEWETLWNVTLSGAELEMLEVRGVARAALGADLVRQTTPPPPRSFLDSSTWLVGVGTPTESRFFETLRTDPDARKAWEDSERVGHRGSFLFVDGTATNLLPNNDRKMRVARLKPDGAGLRDRLVSALESESARDGVSFAEERMTAGASIVVNNWPGFAEPGRFRRTVAWCCERLDLLPLDSLADWASKKRPSPSDPSFPLKNQILSFCVQEGQAAPFRMHQSKNESPRQLSLHLDASLPLAASLQALLAKHRPETFGRQYDPDEVSSQYATLMVVLPDRVEARIVPLADARFRAFLLDLLRLLADTRSPTADKPHAEFEPHAESAEGAEPGPHAEFAEFAE